MSVISVNNLTKRYGDIVAVKDATFEVHAGEIVSILGPSGSGKSTILRMVAGFETPTEGTIELNGQDIVDVPPFERNLNMLFQSLALFPHLTVAENIEFGLREAGVPKAERQERRASMLEMVQLEGFDERDVTQLSGGEQQRVALARALINEPDIVLFDEPLGSLDRKLRQHMQFEIQRIQKKTNIAFLYVTHDQDIALSISDRMIILNEGEINQQGTVENIYNHPANQFVADFLGDLNSIPATIEGIDNNGITIQANGKDLKLSLTSGSTDDRWSRGELVSIGIRPHAVTLSETPPQAPGSAIEGTVTSRMFQGSEIAYMIETDWEPFNVRVDSNQPQFSAGDKVNLTWDPSDTLIFDDRGEE